MFKCVIYFDHALMQLWLFSIRILCTTTNCKVHNHLDALKYQSIVQPNTPGTTVLIDKAKTIMQLKTTCPNSSETKE